MAIPIRNFCIIAHIDHGKSTLADRMIEVTHTVSTREMREQLLDTMDLERERGITIKLQPVRMEWKGVTVNLIDTPGHVDFAYEVSRSLAAVESAVLLVDASQGVQAQTLSVLYQALDQGLTIIPVINKIDLPHAEPERRAEELIKLLGCKPEEIIFCSGKSGVGVPELLDAVVERTPAPVGDPNAPLRGLVFDCIYDPFRGVVAYIRVMDGAITAPSKIHLVQGGKDTEAQEVGGFLPKRVARENILTGEIGYIVTGLKEVGDIGIGDTITAFGEQVEALPGYRQVIPMVFASLYPLEADEYNQLRESIGKLKLNDAALQFVPEHSPALGSGFRCGFLGMLHLEIVTERLNREYSIETIATVPSVAYELTTTDGETKIIESPADMPHPTFIQEISEPWVRLEVVSPSTVIGNIMELLSHHRSDYKSTQFLDEERVVLTYEVPLSEIVTSFYDDLKSVSSGYASMSYAMLGFRPADLVKLDMMVAGNPIEALSTIVPKSMADASGRRICERLKKLIPKHNFEVAIQATIGGKIIARETISAYRKDVTAKLYGGDVTRRNKLLDKQKKGKARMKQFGSVSIPSGVFVDLLRKDS